MSSLFEVTGRNPFVFPVVTEISDVAQFLFTQAEVVTQLMKQGSTDFPADFLVGGTNGLDVLLIEENPVRQ